MRCSRVHFFGFLVGIAVFAMMCLPLRVLAAPEKPAGQPPQAKTTVLVIGENGNGQLGLPGQLSPSTFTAATAFGTDVVAITGTEGRFTLARKADGSVWACGENTFKQIGEGEGIQNVPVKIAGLSDIIAVGGGGTHGLALKADGTVWCWGGASSWYLFGDSTTGKVSTAQQINGLTEITAIAAGNCHNLALRKDGTVWAWGLWGGGISADWKAMHQLKGLPAIKMIAAGTHSMALGKDGTVWTWGANNRGQLGDGTTTSRNDPTQVPGLTGVIGISAGLDSSFAIKADGTVWAWGGNGNHQLGDGTTENRLTPVQVPGLKNVKEISVSYYGGIALTATGEVWMWGAHQSIPSYPTPKQIPGLKNIIGVSDGMSYALALQRNK